MPRYIVERTYDNGARLPDAANVEENANLGVTWLHSYVAEGRDQTFCLCEAPSPEAIRRAARRSSLPVDRITQVSLLDPYVFRRDHVGEGES
jgi:uncharacterized protein DUF4242